MRYRIREGKIVYELIEPSYEKNLSKCVIVLSGLPNQPRNDDFGENLASEGFYVLQPRYIGNWESDGKFLLKNCMQTVIEAEKLILKGKAIECWNEKEIQWNVDETYLLSSSFGSAVVLSALSKLKTKKIICLCPLVNLTKHNKQKNIIEQDLRQLGYFIQRGFKNAFRGFMLSDWNKFIQGKSIVNPILHTNNIQNKKILLIHGDNDTTINYTRTEEFYDLIRDKNDVELKIMKGIGHGKQLKEASFNYVLEWLIKN